MNKFFCSIGEKLNDNILLLPNPLLSNEYFVKRLSTQFRFQTVSPVSAERALKEMKNPVWGCAGTTNSHKQSL